MTRLPGRLGSLVARHLMTSTVVSLSSSETLESGLSKLKEHHISGAPVVNEQGELVGILSLSDVIDFQSPERQVPTPAVGSYPDWPSLWKLIDESEHGEHLNLTDQVANYMTSTVKSAEESTSLLELARMMCDGHWHHLPIVDANQKLIGIVTTMDIMAALVHTAEESK